MSTIFLFSSLTLQHFASNFNKYWLAVECFIVDCIYLDYMRFATKITNVMLIANKIQQLMPLIEHLVVLVVGLLVVMIDVLVTKH